MKSTVLAVATVAAALLVACAPAPPPDAGGGGSTPTTTLPSWVPENYFDDLLAEFTALRAGSALGPVARCAELDAIAQRVAESDAATNGYSQNWVEEYADYGPVSGQIGRGFFSVTPAAMDAANVAGTLYASDPVPGYDANAFAQPDVVHMGFGAAYIPGSSFPYQVFVAVGTGGTC
jgi:hypothetical protein